MEYILRNGELFGLNDAFCMICLRCKISADGLLVGRCLTLYVFQDGHHYTAHGWRRPHEAEEEAGKAAEEAKRSRGRGFEIGGRNNCITTSILNLIVN